MRLSILTTAICLVSQTYAAFASRVDDNDDHFELVESPDHEYNANGQWVHLSKRYGDDCLKYHTVVEGETCSVIVNQYGLRLNEFYAWNTQVNSKCTNLKVLKKYCVAKDSASLTGGCAKKHTVVKGDTCTKVAVKYGISVGQLYDLNGSINRGRCDNLHLGYQYCVKVKGVNEKALVSKVAHVHKDKSAAKIKKVNDTHNNLVSASESLEEQVDKVIDHEAKKEDQQKKADTSESKKDAEEDKDKKAADEEKKADDVDATDKEKSDDKAEDEDEKTEQEQQQEEEESLDHKITNLKQRQLLKRKVTFTYYWTAHASDYSSSGKKVSVKTCGGKTIATVSQTYANALVMEGSGVISKSKVVNLGSCNCKNYACFMELNAKTEAYGLTSFGTSLRPFVTIAANDIRRNTKIYVPELNGVSLPNGKKHNGCLLVDDQSWSFDGNHIDWFVNHMTYYKTLNKKLGVSKVNIYEGGNCKLLNYN